MVKRNPKIRLFPNVRLPKVKSDELALKPNTLPKIRVPEFETIQEALRKLRRKNF